MGRVRNDYRHDYGVGDADNFCSNWRHDRLLVGQYVQVQHGDWCCRASYRITYHSARTYFSGHPQLIGRNRCVLADEQRAGPRKYLPERESERIYVDLIGHDNHGEKTGLDQVFRSGAWPYAG